MRKFASLWCGLCCATTLLAACVGTETGNPSFEGSLGYDAYSSASAIALQPSALSVGSVGNTDSDEPARVAVRSAWLVLGEVSLLRDADCTARAPSSSVAVQALGTGDHVHSQVPPTKFELHSGEYCGARLPLVLGAENPTAPDRLVDHSLLVRGTLADGRNFELLSALALDVTLHADHAFGLSPEHAGVVIGFDLAHWLEDLAWDQAQAEASGAVVADENSNTELLGAFEARIAGGVGLFRDADNNGLLDDTKELIAHGDD
ncbi:MAG: hypothetical protein RL701_1573 [Pseudomonadota bacterium]